MSNDYRSSNHSGSGHHDSTTHTPDLYQFALNASGTSVVAMSEIEGARIKPESIRGWTFDIERGADGAIDAIERSRSQRGVTKVERYDDADGDGRFEESFSSEVLTTSSAASRADKARFIFEADGDVLSMQALSKGRWKTERLDADEHLEQITLDGVTYVVKVELEDNGAEWKFYRDDNADGIWTEVAEVESSQAQDLVELVGLSDLLALTAAVVG